jgi:hypothetical protein
VARFSSVNALAAHSKHSSANLRYWAAVCTVRTVRSTALQAGAKLRSHPPTPDQRSLPVMLECGAIVGKTLVSKDVLIFIADF